MERKEVDTQQFIDHTLLATELMHLIDQTTVFPKNDGPTNLSTTGNSANDSVNYVEKHPLTPPELNFHNSIFQFVNKHVADEPTDGVPQQGVQPTFPALNIEPTVPIDVTSALQDDDLLYCHNVSTTNARKVLPHKKRISRKLKGTLACMETDYELQKHHVQVPTVASYSCEICGYAVHTQIEFYAHLKEHYDPAIIEQRLDVPQQQQQQQQQQQKEPLDMCGLSVEDKLQQEQAKLDQVFHDVQLNFGNFHDISHVHDNVVDDVGVNMVIHADAISLHKADDKLSPVGSSNTVTSNVVPVVDDVEFSDTEDMLEGIRNVVDKVSIEDTCDELVDLELTTNGIRAPWFNNNFSDIAFSGLLLPGEPPPGPATTTQHPMPVLKPNPIEAEQMTLNFLDSSKRGEEQAQQSSHSKFDICHKKHYIEVTAAAMSLADSESNERTLLVSPPPRTPSPSTGSAIEQLQRSPLMINDSFKLEDVEASAPTDSIASSPTATVIEDNGDNFLMETDKLPNRDDSNGTKRKYHCDKCVRDFNSYNALKYHQLTHTKERAFLCSTCDRSFYTQSALKAHARTHTGLKPYKCEQCEVRFRQWGDLKVHCISRHSDLKAHMCEYCGKSFSRKYSLVVHRRIHTRERNYACQYCDKTFRASSYLLTHIKVHTGEKPYTCTICDKKFRVSGDLKRHARIHDPMRHTNSPVNATNATAKKHSSGISSSSKLKQIEDEDDIINNKSDAVCDEAEQEILGL